MKGHKNLNIIQMHREENGIINCLVKEQHTHIIHERESERLPQKRE